MKKVALLFLMLFSAYAGFRWGAAVFPSVERALGIAAAEAVAEVQTPNPELADRTLDRFERFRAGELGDRLALGSVELSSVVRYALPGIVPQGVAEPTIVLEGGRVHVSARVAVANFPRLPRLDQIVGLLPDTVLIEMRGSLVPLDQAYLALNVDRLSAARVPIPSRMVADVLTGLGREGPASLPKDALQMPLPDGVRSMFVQADSLILLADSIATPGGAGSTR